MNATDTYLGLVSQTIIQERTRDKPNYAALYRTHQERLREIDSDVSKWLLRDLMLAQTTPLTHLGIDDARDGYTGEKLDICTRECDNLMGDGDTYMCLTGVTCLLGEVCPWAEDAPHVQQGKTWLNMPMPPQVLGVATVGIREGWDRQMAVSTESLIEEDDNYWFFHQHWAQSFDDWEQLANFREERRVSYDAYFEEILREYDDVELWLATLELGLKKKLGNWAIPALKFKEVKEHVRDILDHCVSEFLHGNISEMTLSTIFFRMVNGVALNFRSRSKEPWIAELAKEAKEMRIAYRQWLLMTADHLHLIPDLDAVVHWGEEDAELIERWCEFFDGQERQAFKTQVDWEAEKAYREAACKGSPKDAREAAKRVRRKHRGSLAELDEYIRMQ